MIIFLNKFRKHLNVILSISHLKSAECTKVRRVYAFASLEVATSRSCVVETLRRSDLQLHQFVGQKISGDEYAC